MNVKDDLDIVLAFVAKDEGGYAERKIEPGGAVNMGISFSAFAAWRQIQGVGVSTFADLKAMPWAEARAIYEEHYAKPVHFAVMPSGVNYVLLDSAINNGIGGATGFLREALGFPVKSEKGRPLPFSPDIIWGARKRDPATLINAFCDVRLRRQKNFRSYAQPTAPGSKHTFGEVWDRRVTLVRGRALAMVADHSGAKS